ncbi:MAG: hypothetical protein ACJ8EL_15760 [Rhizomicrobium sp.]
MAKLSADVIHLRELASQCRRAAARLDDEIQVTSLSQMAAEYDVMANRIEQAPIPSTLPAAEVSKREPLREILEYNSTAESRPKSLVPHLTDAEK